MAARALVGIALMLAFAGEAATTDRMSPEDLARKNENGYFTGIPLIAYSTDMGFGGGVRGYYYWNGARGDSRFDNTPYLHRVFLQVFASTIGLQYHWLDYDAPQLFHTPYRVRGQLAFERNINQNYFGLGSASLGPLRFPDSTRAYDSYAEYTAEKRRISQGTTWGKYDQYDLLRPLLLASIEREFLDNRLRLLAGVAVTYTRVLDYTGETIDAVDEAGKPSSAAMGTSRLRADCDSGLRVGCNGGRDNYFRLGVSYDTRDFEPDPNEGVFVDLSLDASTRALGSDFDYVRLLVAARGYWSPVPRWADLVIAVRAMFQAQSARTPFFSLNTLPFTEDPRNGLGGHRTMRGYRQDRFVGPVLALTNAEIRWTFARTERSGQKLAFILAPFLDLGRPYDSISELTFRDWRSSYGAAFRVSWNLATLLTVDYGMSREDAGFYVNFNHIF